MIKKKSFFAIFVVFAAVLILFSCKKKSEGKGYRIGATGPLSGGVAVYGKSVQNGAMLAVKEINAAGGIDGDVSTDDDNLIFEMYDDTHNVDKARNGYAKLYEDGMQVSLGSVTTKPCLEFKSLSHDDGVFFITASATGIDVIEYDNAYQMCFSDPSQGQACAEYIRQNVRKGSEIGVFYKIDDDYSKGIYDNFYDSIKDAGYPITVATFDTDNSSDFSAQVNKLKNSKFIFMPIYYEPASAFMKAARGVIANNVEYFGADGFDGIDGDDGLGTELSKIPQKIAYIAYFNASSSEPKSMEFTENYRKEYNETPIQFGASAYDCVYSIRDAIRYAKSKNKNITPSISARELGNILKEVYQDPDFKFNGVTGKNMRWNKDGSVDIKTKIVTSYIIKDFN